MSKRVKVLFEYESGTPPVKEVESIWAVPTEEGFEIDNIPFFAREIALGDVVSAKRDVDGFLRYEALLKPSHHSTVRLWFATGKEAEVPRVRQELRDLGCPSELSDLPRLVAVDIPADVEYPTVRHLLDAYERDGLLEYEESCLGTVE
jgi:hypothetical protein